MKRTIIAIALIGVSFAAFAGGKQESGATSTAAEKTGPAWILSESDDSILPGINPLEVKGDIIAMGSSTVFPLSEVLAARFIDEGYSGNITIDSIGSGAGFERFCVAGESDIANASRPIKQKEIDAAAKIGRTPIEFRLGTDALAVVVSKENTFAKNATMEELALIFGDAVYWSDVNPSWPKKEILRFIPGTDSGTFDYFVEEVYDKKADAILAAKNLQLSEDDNILVQGVEGSQYAAGFFGFAYYAENTEKLNILSIEGVEANAANVDNNSYPLARPIFMYSDAKIMQSKPQVAAFIAYYLTYVNEEIGKVGYFPAAPEALKVAKESWLEAMKGTY
jgi:phosphate transport system substrate-binding protein